jgi:hypothetical protein
MMSFFRGFSSMGSIDIVWQTLLTASISFDALGRLELPGVVSMPTSNAWCNDLVGAGRLRPRTIDWTEV